MTDWERSHCLPEPGPAVCVIQDPGGEWRLKESYGKVQIDHRYSLWGSRILSWQVEPETARQLAQALTELADALDAAKETK